MEKTISTITIEKDYVIRFIGDYFSMTVHVQKVEGDAEVAIALANNIIKAHYGWDVAAVSTIEIEATEEWLP
jgi:hypothetical protein